MVNANYFQLFGLEPNFNLDLSLVKQLFHQQIKQCHPDNFTTADEATKLAKQQQTNLLNEAYQTLIHPVKRAFYLLELAGCDLSSKHTMQDVEFLQMGLELHEQLEQFMQNQDINQIERLEAQIAKLQTQMQQNFAQIYQDQNKQYTAMQIAQKMQFLTNLQIKISTLLDQI